MKKFESIIKKIRKEKVSLFIGAGFSREAGAPSVSEICSSILSQINDESAREEHTNDNLQDLTNYFVEEECSGSRNDLITYLKDRFIFEPESMADHKAMSQIPHFHHIFTTNYDTLLEDSYSEGDRQVVRNDNDCAYIDDKKVTIFKIHGDFTAPDTVVITSEDYKKFWERTDNQLFWQTVKNEFLTRHILFIGYSLEDENILELIREISDSINKNQKQMFLIAPGITADKVGKLRAMKVKYFDAYAAEFFTELTQSLTENIFEDYRTHQIAPETFASFCHHHNIDPTLALYKGKDNQVKGMKSLDGNGLRYSMEMTFPNEFKDKFSNLDFEKDGTIGNRPFVPNIPIIKLTNEQFNNCKILVNGLVVNNDIEAVYIAPPAREIELTVNIPSRNFLERVKGIVYGLKKGKVAIKFDCNSFSTEINIERIHDDEKGDQSTYTFKFPFKETYTDNNAALKWIDLPCALFSKEDIFIDEISDVPFNANDLVVSSQEQFFNQRKKFYQNIREIELKTRKCFLEYTGFTEEAFETTRTILAYLHNAPIVVPCPQGIDFSTNCNYLEDFCEDAATHNEIQVVSTQEASGSFTFNGRDFLIPYLHVLFTRCIIRNIQKGDNGRMKIDFHFNGTSYLKIFSDKSVTKQFPNMKKIS